MFNAAIHRPFVNLNLLHFKVMPVLLASLLTIFTQLVFSQTRVHDSLQSVLNQHVQENTLKINILNEISYQYKWTDFFASQRYAEQALKISWELHFKKGIAIVGLLIFVRQKNQTLQFSNV